MEKSIDAIIKKATNLIDKTVDKIDSITEELFSKVDFSKKSISSLINNGHVEINGKIESLKINGYTVKVPDYVLNPKIKK